MVPFLYWQLSGSSWMPSSSFTEWSLPCFNSLWYVYGTSSQAHVLLICLQFYFQAEDDDDEQMDQDDEPQMQVVLHEVRQYCYLSIGFWEWVALSVSCTRSTWNLSAEFQKLRPKHSILRKCSGMYQRKRPGLELRKLG